MKTIEIFDRGMAAYAFAVGVPLLRVLPGDWQRFEFSDTDGLATAALTAWRDGTAQVNARVYWNAFKALKKNTYTISSQTKMAQENGIGDTCGAA